MEKVKVLIISLSSPIKIGIYKNNTLLKEIESQEKASDFLISFFEELIKEFQIEAIIYTNGPGSFMGIKVTYLILKSIALVFGCEIYAVNGFELNDFKPIRANKNLSFVLENNDIVLKKVEACELFLPKNLLNLNLSDDIIPNYVISAV